MKTPKRVASLLLLTMLLITGCQEPPETAAVVSKNDGTFAAAVAAENDSETNNLANVPQEITEEFTSTDGKIRYRFEIDDTAFTDGKLPVLRATPHALTESEGKQVAEALLEGETMYEDSYFMPLTRSELEDRIIALRYASSEEGIRADYGQNISQEDLEEVRNVRESALRDLQKQYDEAPEDIEPQECKWQYQPAGAYLSGGVQGSSKSVNETQMIMARAAHKGFQYRFLMSRRDGPDYRLQTISCYLQYQLEDDLQLAMSEICYRDIPTQQEMEAAKSMAEAMIQRMDMGQWQIVSIAPSEVYSQTYGTHYSISLVAEPVFSGVPLLWVGQPGSVNKEDAYAETYYNTCLSLCLGKNGSLIYMELQSPLDVVETLNDNVPVLDYKELMDSLRSKLTLDDADSYNPDRNLIETGSVEVTVDEMELSLVRTRIKDDPTDFYLVPSVSIYGSYVVYDKSGMILFDSAAEDQEKRLLLSLNAVDNSTIDLTSGY